VAVAVAVAVALAPSSVLWSDASCSRFRKENEDHGASGATVDNIRFWCTITEPHDRAMSPVSAGVAECMRGPVEKHTCLPKVVVLAKKKAQEYGYYPCVAMCRAAVATCNGCIIVLDDALIMVLYVLCVLCRMLRLVRICILIQQSTFIRLFPFACKTPSSLKRLQRLYGPLCFSTSFCRGSIDARLMLYVVPQMGIKMEMRWSIAPGVDSYQPFFM